MTTARECEDTHERAVAYFGGRIGAVLIDGIVSALVDESKQPSAILVRPELLSVL
ncbi:MAG TPA: hypothetical protein VFJ06_00830 [Halococcus sp.]|nr:hypothetical protein [Halococcus sp.]